MAERSDALKKAQQKYMEKFAVARIRMERGKYESVQAYAEAAGQSVNSFVVQLIDKTMQQDAVESPAKDSADIIAPDTLEAAQKAADAADETVPEFIHRAVSETAERDRITREE